MVIHSSNCVWAIGLLALNQTEGLSRKNRVAIQSKVLRVTFAQDFLGSQAKMLPARGHLIALDLTDSAEPFNLDK